MPQERSSEVPLSFASENTFEIAVQQWAKSRIDSPMQIISRFDDAGKQLITIGSTLQGLYVAVFTLGKAQHEVPVAWLAALSVSLGLVVFCAAQAICTVPLKMEAIGTYRLFKNRPNLADSELTDAIEKWCRDVDAIAARKHKWLVCAKYLLFINSAASLLLLLNVMHAF